MLVATRFWSNHVRGTGLSLGRERMRRWLAAGVLVSAALALPSGCKMFERTARCEALAEATNDAIERVAELDSGNDEAASPDAYEQIAQHYQQLDEHLTALADSHDKEFGAAVSTLRAVLRTSARECERYATHLRDLAEATEQGSAARVTSSTRQLQTVRGRMEKNQRSYAAANERIVRLCSPK